MTTLIPTRVSVGRQPIYDQARNIIAYEVLYRADSSAVTAQFEHGDAATARMLVNILTEIGLEQSCGSKPLFLNCTRYFLEHEPILPPERCVLEILETVTIDEGLVKAVAAQRKRGYKIALDDFVYRREWEPLLKLADYVKFDIRQYSSDGLRRAVKQLPGFSGTLLAEKIETPREMEFCRQLGFKLFQGYYLRKPDTLVGLAAPNNLIALVSLSQQLMDQDVNAAEIAQSIQADVTLTYRLLRLANSAMTGNRQHIDSIRHAVSIAGTDLLARWVALLGLLRIEDSPGDYLELALQRAYACERLSREEHLGRPDQAYMLGLLSLLDAMLSSPWEALLPCVQQTVGLLQRRHFRIEFIKCIGKESNCLEAVESGSIHDEGEVYVEYPDELRDEWECVIRPALQKIKLSILQEKTGLSRRTLIEARTGRSRPHPCMNRTLRFGS